MAYIRMSKEERRQGTYEWLSDQTFIALKDDILHWLRFNPKSLKSYHDWFAETYPVKPIESDLHSQITQIIEWLEACDYQVEAFEDWYVDQVVK